MQKNKIKYIYMKKKKKTQIFEITQIYTFCVAQHCIFPFTCNCSISFLTYFSYVNIPLVIT